MHVAAGWEGVFVTVFRRGVSMFPIMHASTPMRWLPAAECFELAATTDRARTHDPATRLGPWDFVGWPIAMVGETKNTVS